jgi:hypothetical protein
MSSNLQDVSYNPLLFYLPVNSQSIAIKSDINKF